MMKMNEYQEKALVFAQDATRGEMITYAALGLCGEAGEVADKLKKILRDKDGYIDTEDRDEIALEVGDVLWYCAVLANSLEYSLEEIAAMNCEKLQDRKDRNAIGGSGDHR
jgi:NTP pyrophosphatase (non-canonical NTP hydrolase)